VLTCNAFTLITLQCQALWLRNEPAPRHCVEQPGARNHSLCWNARRVMRFVWLAIRILAKDGYAISGEVA
jgi:hypothetical protein